MWCIPIKNAINVRSFCVIKDIDYLNPITTEPFSEWGWIWSLNNFIFFFFFGGGVATRLIISNHICLLECCLCVGPHPCFYSGEDLKLHFLYGHCNDFFKKNTKHSGVFFRGEASATWECNLCAKNNGHKGSQQNWTENVANIIVVKINITAQTVLTRALKLTDWLTEVGYLQLHGRLLLYFIIHKTFNYTFYSTYGQIEN